jgi:hypothetical protein
MTIAVHINTLSAAQNFISEFYTAVFSTIAIRLPQHQFLFIGNATTEKLPVATENISYHSIPTISNLKFIQHSWTKYKLSAFFKKNKVDYFFSDANMLFSKLYCNQMVYCMNAACLKNKKATENLKSVEGLLVPNNFVKAQFVAANILTESALHVVEPAMFHTFSPLSATEKETAKSAYSDGKEFFTFHTDAVADENIILVLKAFSIFKKWQKSNMQLHLITPNGFATKTTQLLENYKFKSDVVVVETGEAQAYFSAAYASIFVSEQGQLTKNMLLNCSKIVPMLVPKNDFNQSAFENGAGYFELDAESLSKQMILIYKDESYRSGIINAMQQRANAYLISAAAQKIMALFPKN